MQEVIVFRPKFPPSWRRVLSVIASSCLQAVGTSIYRGVSYVNAHDRYRASLKVDGKQYYIGEWEDELEAARQVDSSEVRLAGR